MKFLLIALCTIICNNFLKNMNQISSWGQAITTSLFNAWNQIMLFIPKLLGAIIVFIVGWIIATIVYKLIYQIFRATRLDYHLERTGPHQALSSIGIKGGITMLLAKIIKWIIIVIFLAASIEVLQISQLSALANNIVLFIPNIFVAVVIFIVGLIAARLLFDIVHAAVLASRLPNTIAGLLANLVKWIVLVFALMAALVQVKIASNLILILFTGFVAMMAIAGGLAIGLGGQDKVRDWLNKINW